VSSAEAARALKENARALRTISVRRTVGTDDERDIRAVAAYLDELALELTTKGIQTK
jgi:hypothetical protein